MTETPGPVMQHSSMQTQGVAHVEEVVYTSRLTIALTWMHAMLETEMKAAFMPSFNCTLCVHILVSVTEMQYGQLAEVSTLMMRVPTPMGSCTCWHHEHPRVVYVAANHMQCAYLPSIPVFQRCHCAKGTAPAGRGRPLCQPCWPAYCFVC